MQLKAILKASFRLGLFIGFISSYMLTSLLILVVSLFSFERARLKLIQNISFHSKMGLKIFNIKVNKNVYRGITEDSNLIVANHLSYLDILIISSQFPACFVTSFEMKETPFLGQLCSLGGCLFVERRSRKGISGEVANLVSALNQNMNVVIFPEATSTNGEKVIRFKRPLFQSAIDANKDVLPLCLNYRKIDKKAVDLSNRDLLFWYGDMPFTSHFLKLLTVDEIEVELDVLDKIILSEQSSKLELADIAYEKIASAYLPIIN